VCTARAVTQGSHTHGRAARPRADHPAPSSSFLATRAADLITSYRMVYPSEVSLHPRTRTSDTHEPPFGAIAQFMDGGPWHRHDLTGRLSNQQPHLFPTRLVMPFSQSIVVMIGSVSILRLHVTLTRALMHSVIHTAFPCDCISSWKWIEMEMDPI